MFQVLAKTLDWLLSPLSWSLLLWGAALLSLKRPRRLLGFALSGVAVLVAFSSGPVSNALDRWAERSAVRTARPEVTYDAVIVLGGGFEAGATRASGDPQYSTSGQRVVRGFEMLRSGWARQAILSGGTLDPSPGAVREAQVMDAQLQSWGIDGSRLVVEANSRDTHENAVETAALVRSHGYRSLVLVTSAAHMERALGCFHAVGLFPDAMPVDFRHSDDGGRSPVPRAGHLAASTDALRELAGRVVYRAMGYSAP